MLRMFRKNQHLRETGLWQWGGVTRRCFADDGGEEGGGGGGAAAATADPAEGTGEPAAPWYAEYEPDEKDKALLGRYKTAQDAIKSIGSRERRMTEAIANSKISFPDESANPEDAQKAHRVILAKMGAPKDIAGYKAIIDDVMAHLPESLKGKFERSTLEAWAQDSLEVGHLPWQFERMVALSLPKIEERLNGSPDDRVARQDTLERSLKLRYGMAWADQDNNAKLAAKGADEWLAQNAKGLFADGQVPKNAFSQMLADSQNPLLHALFVHLFETNFSEGDGGRPPLFKNQGNDAYTEEHARAKARWPNSPQLVEQHMKEWRESQR